MIQNLGCHRAGTGTGSGFFSGFRVTPLGVILLQSNSLLLNKTMPQYKQTGLTPKSPRGLDESEPKVCYARPVGAASLQNQSVKR
jgi:hypothetical protein